MPRCFAIGMTNDASSPAPPRDGERVALAEAELLEPDEGGEPVHGQRRRLLERRTLGYGNDRRRRDDEQLRLRSALRASRRRDRHHAVTDGEPLDSGADGLDHPARVPACHPRREDALDAALARADVGRMHGGGVHRDATSPSRGSGTSRSITRRTSTPPGSVMPTARALVTANPVSQPRCRR